LPKFLPQAVVKSTHVGSIIANASNESIAREATLALGTINTPEARKILSSAANQTRGIVRETIIEIIGTNVTHEPDIANFSGRTIKLKDGFLHSDSKNENIADAKKALAELPMPQDEG